ncbi:MAG TPA: nucleoside deaminase [Salinivirga sp.]|uniref:nucleoside deaminase n=1 Tax=Salinivirga sp. TaxID=1970192 RepID=UPI002B486EB5|nr:nucleoside deaminase [Salinivirga sp.]HKK59808.1 nucleoside deaminase [Salinivirga sp.]
MDKNELMKQAIKRSIESVAKGGGPFGAIIAKDGEVIAEASNSVTLTNDPTAHAEINAIRQATQKLGTFDLSGCEIYSSCEPCPMCLGAIYWARLDKLYFAGTKTDAMEAGFDDSFIYDELKLDYADRKLYTRQMMREKAKEAFDKWRNFEEKIEY